MKSSVVAFLLLALFSSGCGSNRTKEKIAQIRVWEDQGWTANGRMTSLLSDKDEMVRERAALALGRVDDTLALDSLKRVLISDPSPKVRANAAFSLGIWTWKVGKAALLDAVAQERDPEVLVTILHSLARVYARDEYLQFLPYLHDADPRVRAQTALTLDMVNRRDVADSIVPLLDDPDVHVRNMAMYALARMNSAHAARQGARFVNDTSPETRVSAYRLMGSANFQGRREAMLRGFDDPDVRVRCAVAEACVVMRDTAIINAVLPRLASEQSVAFIQRVLRAVAEHPQAEPARYVLPLLSHADPTVRAQAVTALCNRRDVPCWEHIASAEQDPDWRVRVALLEVIGKTAQFIPIDTQIVYPLLRRRIHDPAPRVRTKALQAYGDYGGGEAIKYLNEHLHDSSDYVVGAAVSIIGSNHINIYVDSLYQLYQKYADDPDPDVKWALTASLMNMLPSIQIDSLRQDIINWGMADPNRLVRWYTIAAAKKFRQDRRNELGTYLTDLTVENIDSLLPVYTTPPLARIGTTKGVITVELDTYWAPRAVRQFVASARNGCYDNTPVNEIQGVQMTVLGDRTGEETNLPSANVRDEYSPRRVEPGTLMWSIVSRDSGRGVFMIALARLPYQDWRYPVFGQVREGIDVARSLTLADSILTVQIVASGIS